MTDLFVDFARAASLAAAWDDMAAAALDLASDRFDRARDRYRALVDRDASLQDGPPQKADSETLHGHGYQTYSISAI